VKKQLSTAIILISCLLILGACSSTKEEKPLYADASAHTPEIPKTPPGIEEYRATPDQDNFLKISPTLAISVDPDRRIPTRFPERVSPDDLRQTDPIVGEVPEIILKAILSDLAQRTGEKQLAFQVLRSEAVIWNDGSLGCPKPGEFYTQALVSGYWVVLEFGEHQFDYRAAESGYFFLCEGDMLPAPPLNAPDS
jgi:hypothetical protein